jgi:DNA-3-methyladenine glycosylase
VVASSGFASNRWRVDAIKHNELPLDRPPIPLHARLSKPDIVAGVRIGITKAVELP